jgi:hypothetical protein
MLVSSKNKNENLFGIAMMIVVKHFIFGVAGNHEAVTYHAVCACHFLTPTFLCH